MKSYSVTIYIVKNSKTCLHRTHLGLKVFGLHRFNLHRHLVDGTVKSVWFRQVFDLLRVRFRQVSLYNITPYDYSGPTQ